MAVIVAEDITSRFLNVSGLVTTEFELGDNNMDTAVAIQAEGKIVTVELQ